MATVYLRMVLISGRACRLTQRLGRIRRPTHRVNLIIPPESGTRHDGGRFTSYRESCGSGRLRHLKSVMMDKQIKSAHPENLFSFKAFEMLMTGDAESIGGPRHAWQHCLATLNQRPNTCLQSIFPCPADFKGCRNGADHASHGVPAHTNASGQGSSCLRTTQVPWESETVEVKN